MPETLKLDLGYTPRDWQAEAHRNRRQFTALVVHRRGGKTEWVLRELVHTALNAKRTDWRAGFVAPELKQAKRVGWDRLKTIVHTIPGHNIREGDGYVEVPTVLGDVARINIFGADNPDSLRGLYLDDVGLDEFALMKKEAWESVIQVALMDRNGSAMFISTVGGVDAFSELYFKAKNGDDQRWATMDYDVYQTGVFTPAEIAAMKEAMSDQAFRREFLNDFTAAAPNQLISLDAVMQAQKRAPPKEAFEWAPKTMGVDVAFSPAGDRSVITCRQGSLVYQPEIYRGIDNMKLVDKVSLRHRVFEPDALFIDKGRGEGVIARLRQLGYPVIGVDFGGTSGDPRFRRKKDEMIVTCADAVRDEWALPDMQEYRVEGPSMTCHFQATTDKLYVEYDSVLPSPDVWVSLALTVAHPVNVRRGPGASLYGRQRRRVKADTDPLKTMLGDG